MKSTYWNFIEPYWGKIDMDSEAVMQRTSESMPPEVVALYAAHFCQSEIHNGGFLQLFWNTTGILVPAAVKAFAKIGMPRFSELMRSAAAPLGTPYPLDRDERWDALLDATSLTQAQLDAIFTREEKFFIAFRKATEELNFDLFDKQAWELAKSENGGFDKAADTYVQSLSIPNPTHSR